MALFPEQIAVGLAITVSVGPLLTGITKVVVALQPPLFPVTVYIVVTGGLKLTMFPNIPPGFHV